MSHTESEWSEGEHHPGGVTGQAQGLRVDYWLDLDDAAVRGVKAANPELLSIDGPPGWHDVRFGTTETVFTIILTLAFAPFLQSMMTALGNKSGEALAAKASEQLRKLLDRRDKATDEALNGEPFKYLLQVERTNVRISLPDTKDTRVKAITTLLDMHFDAFGDYKVDLWWNDYAETWEGSVVHVVSCRVYWNKEERAWFVR